MAKLWFRIFLTTVSFTTFVMAVVVIATSSVTIVGVVKAGGSKSIPSIAKTVKKIGLTNPGDTKSRVQIVSGDEEPHFKHKFVPKFRREVKGEYKKVVLGCLISTICAGVLQMLSSLFVLLSCSKDVRRKIKSALIVNLMVFLILLVTFALPLAYDSTEGHRLTGVHEIRQKVETHFHQFKDKNVWESVVHELNAFFITVGLNEGILLATMILLCTSYCMKCGDYNYHPIS